MNLMIYLTSLGLVWVIKDSYIFLKPRTYLKSKSFFIKELLSCSLCLGFWSGLISYLFTLQSISFSKEFILSCFFYSFSVSAFCWFFDSLLDLIQESTLYLYNKNK